MQLRQGDLFWGMNIDFVKEITDLAVHISGKPEFPIIVTINHHLPIVSVLKIRIIVFFSCLNHRYVRL
jgi:hypothetical protein